MNNFIQHLFLRSLVAFACLSSIIIAYDIQHVEPPFWWTGMVDKKLQLMIHGENISDLNPEIDHKGVEIEKIHRLENKNYLFIDLLLNNAKPGSFDILFKRSGKIESEYKYDLLERDPGSMERKGFDPSDVIYLITPDRYANGNQDNDTVEGLKEGYDRTKGRGRHGGDIQGIIDHIDYIKDMGFTQLWINPLLENDQEIYSYHGYSTTDYYKIDPRFGSNELYRSLSNIAQENGIGIIMDLILNHIGSEHWWMYDLPSSDWINYGGTFVQTNHTHHSIYDPHTPQSEKDRFTDGWFVETMPDLNQANPFLAKYLIQVSIWWIEYADLSGFRIDTYPYVDKDFLTVWSRTISEEYPNFNFFGEAWIYNPAMVSYWQKGSKPFDDYISYIPSMKDFPLQKALVEGLTSVDRWDRGIGDIYRVLADDFQYGDPYNLVIFAGNHDMQRIFSQLNEDMDLFKMAMSFILTTRGIPQIYYGTEIAMKSTGDHGELRKDFPGGWTGDKIDAFNGKRLKSDQREAQTFMKKLLNWRKASLAVTKGNLVHYPVKNGLYVYFRSYESDVVMVIMNNNKSSKMIDLKQFEELLSNKDNAINIFNDRTYKISKPMRVPGKTTMVLDIE